MDESSERREVEDEAEAEQVERVGPTEGDALEAEDAAVEEEAEPSPAKPAPEGVGDAEPEVPDAAPEALDAEPEVPDAAPEALDAEGEPEEVAAEPEEAVAEADTDAAEADREDAGTEPEHDADTASADGNDAEEEAPATEADESPEATDEGETSAEGGPADFDLIGAARSVTEVGSRSVTDGISAMREVSRAKRAHAKARETLANLEQKAQEEADELAHRRDVEHNYDEIIRVQRAEISDATADGEKARQLQASLEAQRDETKARLKRLKGDNDRRISPYKELAESAKGTLDDAERAWSEARRGLRAAQAQADDATNSRDSRLAAANRAVDNAAERLARLQDQLAQIRRDPSTGSKEISEMSGDVAAALAQLENAREDVARVTAETNRAVEIAQTHLYTQKKSLEEAEEDLETARTDEQEKRETHRKLRDEADEAERELVKASDDLDRKIADAKRAQTEAQGRVEAAGATIEEADDIHAHPEATLALEKQAQESREAAEAQHQQVEALADEERNVRERTRTARRVFLAIVAAVVVALLLVAWLVTR